MTDQVTRHADEGTLAYIAELERDLKAARERIAKIEDELFRVNGRLEVATAGHGEWCQRATADDRAALVKRLHEEVARYGAECSQTKELAPRTSLIAVFKEIESALTAQQSAAQRSRWRGEYFRTGF